VIAVDSGNLETLASKEETDLGTDQAAGASHEQISWPHQHVNNVPAKSPIGRTISATKVPPNVTHSSNWQRWQ
jgi:hypothetical protein